MIKSFYKYWDLNLWWQSDPIFGFLCTIRKLELGIQQLAYLCNGLIVINPSAKKKDVNRCPRRSELQN